MCVCVWGGGGVMETEVVEASGGPSISDMASSYSLRPAEVSCSPVPIL